MMANEKVDLRDRMHRTSDVDHIKNCDGKFHHKTDDRFISDKPVDGVAENGMYIMGHVVGLFQLIVDGVLVGWKRITGQANEVTDANTADVRVNAGTEKTITEQWKAYVGPAVLVAMILLLISLLAYTWRQ
ncbi:unnamed protein product, partial [Mesorhabditis spiculigera]